MNFICGALPSTMMDLYRSDAVHFRVDEERQGADPALYLDPGPGRDGGPGRLWNSGKGKRFISIEEFSAACPKVSKTHIDKLTAAGAFGDLPATGQLDLFAMLG